MIAVQLAADLVLQLDARIVEAAARGDRKRLGHVEGVERVDARILIDGAQRDRADRDGIAGLAEKDAAAADDVVRTDSAEFGTCREICDAGVKAPADDETVIMAEQLIGVGRLQLHARRWSTSSWCGRSGRAQRQTEMGWRVARHLGHLPGTSSLSKHSRVGSSQGCVAVGLPSTQLLLEDAQMRGAFNASRSASPRPCPSD